MSRPDEKCASGQFTSPNGVMMPSLWIDWNIPADAEGAVCAVVDEGWRMSLSPGSRVVLDDREGTRREATTLGTPWRGPSGTLYVRAVPRDA